MEPTHVFESHHEFYSVIENQEQLLNEHKNLRNFKYYLHLTIHGCTCDTIRTENLALDLYRNISLIGESSFDKIKLLVNANQLVFKLNNEVLFTI